MKTLYSLQDLSLNYQVYDNESNRKINITALDNISLDIFKNEFLAIIGSNGSGKTSLGKLLAGLANSYQGDINYQDKLIDNYNREIFKDVGMVIQEPQNQLLMPTVSKELSYPLENRRWPKEKIIQSISKYARMFKLEDVLDRSPDQLSGGQITSLALASILITEPEVIILDEPDSHFDSGSKSVMREFIDNYRGKKAIILITQYVEETKLSDRIVAFEKGKIVAQGSYEEVIGRYYYQKEPLEPEGIRSRKDIKSGEKIIEVQDISYNYNNKNNALDGISLNIYERERIGILGEMGSGKTTLGLIMSGLIEPGAGIVSFKGIPLKNYDELNLRKLVSYSMQFPERVLFEDTVAKDIAFGPENVNTRNPGSIIDELTRKFNIAHLHKRHPFTVFEIIIINDLRFPIRLRPQTANRHVLFRIDIARQSTRF
jgi:energy-coupling factor transporter ATP-binding protein EcfA2